MKVLFHIDDNQRWEQVLKNASHLLMHRPEATVEIVAHGSAVQSLLQSENQTLHHKINDIITQNGQVCACHHSLEALNKTEDDVISNITIVPARILEIVAREEEGYCYIKP